MDAGMPLVLIQLPLGTLAVLAGLDWRHHLAHQNGRIVDRLGKEARYLKDGQRQMLQLLKRHVGYHRRLASAVAAAPSDPSR